MDDVFLKYMDKRLSQSEYMIPDPSKIDLTGEGPVITVSRETGCLGYEFVRKLAVFINRIERINGKRKKWHWVNKEIIFASARELEVPPSRVDKLFKAERRKMMNEIVDALATRYYKSDRVVTKAIKQVIKNLITEGNVIILGRGGVALSRHVSKSLHIKLFGPLEWRIENIRKKLDMSYDEAKRYIHEMDKARKQLIDNFAGKECDECIFDLEFNRKTMKDEEMFTIIHGLLKYRQVI